MGALLALIPRSVLALALAATLALLGAQSWRLGRSDAALTTLQATVAAERQQAADAAAQASERRRLDERRITQAQTEGSNHANQDRAVARPAAVAAAVAGGGLRVAIDAVADHGRAIAEDPAAARQCQAAGAANAVLAELLGQCADRRIDLARYADETRAAGIECVGRYDPLTTASTGAQ